MACLAPGCPPSDGLEWHAHPVESRHHEKGAHVPTYIIGILGVVVLLVLIALLVISRYKVAGPNEAFIVTGRRGKQVRNAETGQVSTDLSGQKVVMGGGVFVIPFVQRLYVMDLSSRRIMVQIRGAVSGQGIKLNLDGVAIVKVGGNEDSIRAAAQRFLSQQEEIEVFTQETLAGSLRSIVGSLSVEQIIRDRAAFAQRVADESEASLTGQGLVLDTFQIQDITDDGTYLSDLGRPEAAKVQQYAAVAEAAARQEAEQARLKAQEQIAISERQLMLKQAEIKSETDAAAAQAAASGPLAQADRDQAILTEQEKVAIRQAALKDRQLDTEVRKPADAERYRIETEAEARKNSRILEAEAAAIEGAKRGEAEQARRVAEAQAVKAEGEARAAAILATGEAEAEVMNKKAEAYARYTDAAVIEMLISKLPEIAGEVAGPMKAIDKLTVISTDGASAVSKQVTNGVVQSLQLLQDTTGVDLTKALARYTSNDAAQPAQRREEPKPEAPAAE